MFFKTLKYNKKVLKFMQMLAKKTKICDARIDKISTIVYNSTVLLVNLN